MNLQNKNIKLDFVLLCETFLQENINVNYSALFHLPGYEFIYKNRVDKARGGVAMYIRNAYKFKLRH